MAKPIPLKFYQENFDLLYNNGGKEISEILLIDENRGHFYRRRLFELIADGKLTGSVPAGPKPIIRRKVQYLSNTNILIELRKSHEQNKMSNELGKMLILLVHNIAKKPNFSGYSYLDVMKSAALENCCLYWSKFDCDWAAKNPSAPGEKERPSNPFAYFTSCITNSFVRVINKEKEHQDLREDLKQIYGEQASFTRQLDNDALHHDHD